MTTRNGPKEIQFPELNLGLHVSPSSLLLVRLLPLSLARHLHPLFPQLQPRLLVDLLRRPRNFIQTHLRLMQVSHKISVDHRVQCGGKRKVPNEKPQAPFQILRPMLRCSARSAQRALSASTKEHKGGRVFESSLARC